MSAASDVFLRTVLKSGLLERDLLKTSLRHLPRPSRDDPRGIADFLIDAKLLTPYQAEKLLRGVTLGLTLGQYQIQAPIGRGGMGTVYLGVDTRNQRPVAIKVLSPKRAREGERHLARFQREMALSAKLQHPNAALTLDSGVHAGVHYIVLEYIPGQTLLKLVLDQGPLAPPRAARLFSEVASALEQAHQQGLIHRDIKPSNIMVTPDDHAKVLDLGLALMVGEEVEDTEVVGGKGYVVGSVEYIPPEQTRDATAVDGRADLYALGCTLYFALSGRVPFPGGNSKEKIHAHRHLEPEPLFRRNPAVPEAMAQLVHDLMAKKPEQRPASASLVRQELLKWSDPSYVPPVADARENARKQARKVSQQQTAVASDTLSEVFRTPDAGDSIVTVDAIDDWFDTEDRERRILWWLIVGLSIAGVVIFMFLIIVLLAR